MMGLLVTLLLLHHHLISSTALTTPLSSSPPKATAQAPLPQNSANKAPSLVSPFRRIRSRGRLCRPHPCFVTHNNDDDALSATFLKGKPMLVYAGWSNALFSLDNHVQRPAMTIAADYGNPLLRNWMKIPQNPILTAPASINSTKFRDPTIGWIGADNTWAECEVIPYLKHIEKSKQPQDFWPEPFFVELVDELKELKPGCAEFPNDYLVCLVGDMITKEALPTYQTMLNTLDGVQHETGASLTSWASMSFEEQDLTRNIDGLVLLSVLNFYVMGIIVSIFIFICVQCPSSCKDGHQPPFQIFICFLSLGTSTLRTGDASNDAVSAVLKGDASNDADQDAQGRPPIYLVAIRGGPILWDRAQIQVQLMFILQQQSL